MAGNQIDADLQEQLVNEQAKLQATEQKYAAQRQTLQRLYNDISQILTPCSFK